MEGNNGKAAATSPLPYKWVLPCNFEHSLKFTTHSCLMKPSHLQPIPLSANLQTSPVDGVFLLSVPEPELESGLRVTADFEI